MDDRSPVLPADLRSDLSALRQGLIDNRNVCELVTRTIEKIGRLPLNCVSAADWQIARAGEFWHKYSRTARLGFFRRRKGDDRHLTSTPGLELLFLFHSDGHLREAALKRVRNGLPSPFFVAAVELRSNDWAEQVRTAARECSARVFPLTNPAHLAEVLVVQASIRQSWLRWQGEPSIFATCLNDRAVIRESARILKDGQQGMSRAFRQLMRYEALDPYLPELARNARQPAIRAIATRALIDREARWPLGLRWQWVEKAYGIRRQVLEFETRPIETGLSRYDLIETASFERLTELRRIAMSAVIQYLDGTAKGVEIAKRLERDSSPSVRSRAEFFLRRQH